MSVSSKSALSKSRRLSPPTTGNAIKAPPEILMIEDSATDAELAQRALRRAGIANPLAILVSGEMGMDYLLGTGSYKKRGPTRPLLILLDLKLPGMSGIDFLRQLKCDERIRDIPIATLSLTKSAPAIVTCLRLGVDDHVIKPVDGDALVRLAKKLKLPLTKLPLPAAKSRVPGDDLQAA